MKLRTHAISAGFIVLAFALPTGSSFAADKPAPIAKVSPVGSCTYFVILTIWSPDGVDVSTPIPATLPSARQMQRLLRDIARVRNTPPEEAEAVEASDNEPTIPPDELPEPKPLSVQIWQFTTTVWSDGSIEHSSFTPATQRSIRQIIIRLEAEQEEYLALRNQPLPAKQLQAEPQPESYPLGDRCHARTDAGHRCSRRAKGVTGLCWQHQHHQPAY